VAALHSITADVPTQQQVDSVLLYLSKHSQHIDCIQLDGHNLGWAVVRQLPPNLQLSSLQLHGVSLQLQPGNSWQGMLGAVSQLAALKQLRLKQVTVLDPTGTEALTAALSQLPAGLEHLSISHLLFRGHDKHFHTDWLWKLHQLTYLELVVSVSPLDDDALQPLQALTRLADLRLVGGGVSVTASMLSATYHLTRFELSRGNIEPGALAGKSRLQHLGLNCWRTPVGSGDVAQLLVHLQQLNQLTHLVMCHWCACEAPFRGDPPAAAFAAVTASSKLQDLDVSWCTLPAGALQHMFPADRTLPHLQELGMAYVKEAGGTCATAPAGSRLVSCCHGLRCLDVRGLQCSSVQLAPLQGLSGLQTLHLPQCGDEDVDGLQLVCQLTGLKELSVTFDSMAVEGLQLQLLTDLKQLTQLSYAGPVNGVYERVRLTCKVGLVLFFAPLSLLTCCDSMTVLLLPYGLCFGCTQALSQLFSASC
jgi:hypothetical protein